MKIDLSGRTAVVTGAAQGIGEATARQLCALGANVVISDIQEEAGRKVVTEIEGGGGQAEFIAVDVSKEHSIREMIEGSVRRFGRLDILVNNAHFEVAGSATEVAAEDWDRSLAVLLRAQYLGAKYAIPHMRRVGGGNIVNMGSVISRRSVRNYIVYPTAKAAVVQLTRQLALDCGPDGIRVNCVAPGSVSTPFKRPTQSRSVDDDMARLTPLRRLGQPDDIAHAVCFLVSEYASFVTGIEFIIDGGQSLPFLREARDRMVELRENTDS